MLVIAPRESLRYYCHRGNLAENLLLRISLRISLFERPLRIFVHVPLPRRSALCCARSLRLHARSLFTPPALPCVVVLYVLVCCSKFPPLVGYALVKLRFAVCDGMPPCGRAVLWGD